MANTDELVARYPALAVCRNDIQAAYELLVKCFSGGGRLYICGNGGSAADALHIAGELVKSFVLKRELDEDFRKRAGSGELLGNLQGALPAYALTENIALATAFANDVSAEYVFAQQVYAYAREGNCVLCISTSGNSHNIIHAIEAAKGRAACTIGLTGKNGGKMKAMCDCCVCVPETETYKIQELHLPVYHNICLMLEEYFFGEVNL
ncbi:MAG: SIS domain-containing protein [Synergistaceae bacterium]|jgi:D-sedoheptulose 7-phosphate isomerase|nr:SIS domain-containing protein [Synergistaceae bacterium]